jgi:hypothetical protein
LFRAGVNCIEGKSVHALLPIGLSPCLCWERRLLLRQKPLFRHATGTGLPRDI